VTHDDDRGGEHNALIDYVATDSGTFYLGAQDYSTGIGTYTVSANTVVVDDYAGDVSTSGVVLMDGSSTGWIGVPGDADWFKVVLTAGESYRFRLASTGLADPVLRLYSPTGAQTGTAMLTDDNSGGGVDALINVTAPVSGNYYLGVTDSGDELGGYTLSTARVATDDRAADASTTGRVAVGGSTSGTVETARDVDWFAVTLEAGIHYRFRLEGNGLADPYLVLYDNAGTECTHDDDRGGLRNAQIDYVAPASGTFFLAASGAGDGVGPYTVSAQVAPADDFTADATTTGQVLVGGTARGLIETKADRDWFAVFLTAGATYQFDLTHGTLPDPKLTLYGPAGEYVDSDDDDGPGADASLQFTAATTGTYYLEAQGFVWLTGSYTLSACRIVPVDDYAADASTLARVDVGSAVLGRIETMGDRDWLAVTLAAGTHYQFRLNGRDLPDPYLTLFASDGVTRITDGDDFGNSNDARIDFTPAQSGTYYLEARDASSGTGGYTFEAAVITPPADGSYSIRIVFDTGGQSEYERYLPYFTAAAERWMQVVRSDLPDVQDVDYGPIDDLLILASVGQIDEAGHTVGWGRPTASREGPMGLPFRGEMKFDVADLAWAEAHGELLDLILHEMGHVLAISGGGFGKASLLDPDDEFRYVGEHGLAAYRQVANDPSLAFVPLEQFGGPGTVGSHWSDEYFDTELMTGFLDPPPMPLSIVTVGALADLGYGVDYAAADPFSL
jgi:hypothetical protein